MLPMADLNGMEDHFGSIVFIAVKTNSKDHWLRLLRCSPQFRCRCLDGILCFLPGLYILRKHTSSSKTQKQDKTQKNIDHSS